MMEKIIQLIKYINFSKKKTVDLDKKLKILHGKRAYDPFVFEHKYILA